MPEDELRLTQEEWRVLEAQRECASHGHDWQITYDGNNVPLQMSCERPCRVGLFKIEPAYQNLRRTN